jgi:hypothetical protein
MRAQIISEGDMALDLGRIRAEEMDMRDAITRCIAKGAIAPPRYAELAMPNIAERLELRALPDDGNRRRQLPF